jgi:hypothetical protein
MHVSVWSMKVSSDEMSRTKDSSFARMDLLQYYGSAVNMAAFPDLLPFVNSVTAGFTIFIRKFSPTHSQSLTPYHRS